MHSSSGPLTLQVHPQMQIARKINENWQLYLITQPSAMCLQQTLSLRRVIILGAPLWVRLCFGNWFWILDSFLFEPPCWNPFYQCLWAEAEVLFPRDPAYRTSCFCSSCGARAGSSWGHGQTLGSETCLLSIRSPVERSLFYPSVSHPWL